MSRPQLRIERLGAHHDLSTFQSGNADLDGWLRRHAPAAQEMDSARTFLLIGDERIVGYFSLTMGSVLRADAPAKLVRGLPAYPVGMVLLARLGVEEREQGKDLGTLILAGALRRAVVAGEAAAARLIAVDAVDEEAAHFYAHHGFVSAPQQLLRLYRREGTSGRASMRLNVLELHKPCRRNRNQATSLCMTKRTPAAGNASLPSPPSPAPVATAP